ncbi:MAG: cysteine desulfurase [Flavobacteriales bacterium]|nr:cysteine desulfurase [Flavobacteriales bacterium]
MAEVAEQYSVENVRKQFPILSSKVNGQPLVYFDNAATTQKPQMVIDAIEEYYKEYNANIHRGVHKLAQVATEAYENSRNLIAQHLNAKDSKEIIFTMGATDAINLVAQTWGRQNIKEGDLIIFSGLEHHSNMVPWQMLASEKGAKTAHIPVLDDGTLDLDAFNELLQKGPKLVAVNHISNALGIINPIEEIISKSHDAGAKVLIDGAQSVPHETIDVQKLDADFYVFSGHKVYGPTGIGVLYGKEQLLDELPPWRGGGEMIASVSYTHSTYNSLPHKYEAGTPNIAGGIVLGKAIEFVRELGMDNVKHHELELLNYATQEFSKIDGLRIFGTGPKKTSVMSFLVDGVHPYDLGTLLDQMGIAVRTGHHCAEPLMNRFEIPGTIRASFACYNTQAEIDQMVSAMNRGINMLR